MGRKKSTTGELEDDPEPLVLIPYQRKYWQAAVMLVPLAALIVYLIFLLAGRLIRRCGWSRPVSGPPAWGTCLVG